MLASRSPAQGDLLHLGGHQGAHVLANVVSENGLVLRAPELPLEPGLRLALVGNLGRRGSALDLLEIRHGAGAERA